MTKPGEVPPRVGSPLKRSARSLSRNFLAAGLILVAYGIWLRHEHEVATWVMLVIVGVGLIVVFTNALRLTK
jgi:F0F1-type ATP synthase assembly protein I